MAPVWNNGGIIIITYHYLLDQVPAILMNSKTAISVQFQFPKCRLYFNITVYNQNQNL